MQGLTKRQREILDFIESFLTNNRYSPSYREIQNHFGFSSLATVYNHVQALKKKKVLPDKTHKHRSLKVITDCKKTEAITIPLIGKLRGGMPIETFAQVETMTLPASMVSTEKPCYLLQIVGDELEEEGIKKDDLLLLEPTTEFEDKEMILIQIGKHTTLVKRGFHDSPYLRLESENPQVQPMILREDHVQTIGIILLLIRKFH